MGRYYWGDKSRDALIRLKKRVYGRPRPVSTYKRRRGKIGRKGKKGGGGDVVFALIDQDIPGVIEEDPPITVGEDELNLYVFEITLVDLPFFEELKDGDEGYVEGARKWRVATTSGSSGGSSRQYDTKEFGYLDGKDFEVGQYTKSDYPDYPENESWPPDGTGTYDELPEGFLDKKFRAQAKPNASGLLILDMRTCKQLDPDPLPESVES